MKKQDPKKDIEEFVDEHAAAVHAENERIARLNRVLRAELGAEREKATAAQAELGALEKTLTLYERSFADRPEWLLPGKKTEPGRATLIPVLSDIHAGEVVRPAELDGYNKYDLHIAEIRLERFFSRTIAMARSWSAYRYDGAVLAVGGDLVSGDIHDELSETNECSTYDAVLWLVPRIAAGVELLRKAFGRVHIASAPGNHGRDSKIPRYKGRSAHNADTLVMRLVARELAKVEGITFEIPDGLDAWFEIYGFGFSIEHGDELARSFSGTAEIGVLGPLQRGSNRKKVALATQGRSLELALWGHFHQLTPVPSRGFCANGSVKGHDEYARGLKLRPEPPQQALLVCVPDFGVVLPAPVPVADRKAEQW